MSVRLPAALHLKALRALERPTPHEHLSPWQQSSPGLKLMHFALVAGGLLTDVGVAAGPRAVRDVAAVCDSMCVMPHTQRVCVQPCSAAPPRPAQDDLVWCLCAARERSPLPHLRHLCLCGHGLRAGACCALASGLAHATAPVSVRLSGNSAGHAGAEALIAALASITTLRRLDLRANGIEIDAKPLPLAVPGLLPHTLRLRAAQELCRSGLLDFVAAWLASPHVAPHDNSQLGGGAAASAAASAPRPPTAAPNAIALRAVFSHRCARTSTRTCMGVLLLLRVVTGLLGFSGAPVQVVCVVVNSFMFIAQLHRNGFWLRPLSHHAIDPVVVPTLLLCLLLSAAGIADMRDTSDRVEAEASATDIADDLLQLEISRTHAIALALLFGGWAAWQDTSGQHAALSASQRSHWLQGQPGKLRTLVATAVSTYPFVEHGLGAGFWRASAAWLAASGAAGAIERCVRQSLHLRCASRHDDSGSEALTLGQAIAECAVAAVVAFVCLLVVPEVVALLRTALDLALLARGRQMLCDAARRQAAEGAADAPHGPSGRLAGAVGSCGALVSRVQYVLAIVYVSREVGRLELGAAIPFTAGHLLHLIYVLLLPFMPQVLRLSRNSRVVLERTTVLMVSVGFAVGFAAAVLIGRAATGWAAPVPQVDAAGACVWVHMEVQRHHAYWRWVSLISVGQESDSSRPPRRPDVLDGRAQASSVGAEEAQRYAAAVAECNAHLYEAPPEATSSSPSSASPPRTQRPSPSTHPQQHGAPPSSLPACCALGDAVPGAARLAAAAAASNAVHARAPSLPNKHASPPVDLHRTPGLFPSGDVHTLFGKDALGVPADAAIALVATAATAVNASARGSAATAPASSASAPQPQQQERTQQQLHIDLRDNAINDYGALRLMFLLASALPLSHALHGTATLSVHNAPLAASVVAAPAAPTPPRHDEAPTTVYITSAQHDWYVATGAEPSRAHTLEVVPGWGYLSGFDLEEVLEARAVLLLELREFLCNIVHIQKYQVHVCKG